uniref:Uncharacterized protein n=1 Tax=Chromera velia CCMP2878 TaxID=1169474 RepID=A0A0K6SB60_9ALVE|eukprot:Cvel_13171.t1-p1 / transcript=Cvel_13171.t1 / gene=Cvel_13171 / organism=Chromera_velia_CCMP2878 / gene_product=hypothetical protein / transcript_product=hypothetical protein / location=Cvel_scaffold889:36545-48003(+) / protein_length=2438 / sequence_SO=supercontig / SO=protein_coding / is_pseudo=false
MSLPEREGEHVRVWHTHQPAYLLRVVDPPKEDSPTAETPQSGNIRYEVELQGKGWRHGVIKAVRVLSEGAEGEGSVCELASLNKSLKVEFDDGEEKEVMKRWSQPDTAPVDYGTPDPLGLLLPGEFCEVKAFLKPPEGEEGGWAGVRARRAAGGASSGETAGAGGGEKEKEGGGGPTSPRSPKKVKEEEGGSRVAGEKENSPSRKKVKIEEGEAQGDGDGKEDELMGVGQEVAEEAGKKEGKTKKGKRAGGKPSKATEGEGEGKKKKGDNEEADDGEEDKEEEEEDPFVDAFGLILDVFFATETYRVAFPFHKRLPVVDIPFSQTRRARVFDPRPYFKWMYLRPHQFWLGWLHPEFSPGGEHEAHRFSPFRLQQLKGTSHDNQMRLCLAHIAVLPFNFLPLHLAHTPELIDTPEDDTKVVHVANAKKELDEKGGRHASRGRKVGAKSSGAADNSPAKSSTAGNSSPQAILQLEALNKVGWAETFSRNRVTELIEESIRRFASWQQVRADVAMEESDTTVFYPMLKVVKNPPSTSTEVAGDQPSFSLEVRKLRPEMRGLTHVPWSQTLPPSPSGKRGRGGAKEKAGAAGEPDGADGSAPSQPPGEMLIGVHPSLVPHCASTVRFLSFHVCRHTGESPRAPVSAHGEGTEPLEAHSATAVARRVSASQSGAGSRPSRQTSSRAKHVASEDNSASLSQPKHVPADEFRLAVPLRLRRRRKPQPETSPTVVITAPDSPPPGVPADASTAAAASSCAPPPLPVPLPPAAEDVQLPEWDEEVAAGVEKETDPIALLLAAHNELSLLAHSATNPAPSLYPSVEAALAFFESREEQEEKEEKAAGRKRAEAHRAGGARTRSLSRSPSGDGGGGISDVDEMEGGRAAGGKAPVTRRAWATRKEEQRREKESETTARTKDVAEMCRERARNAFMLYERMKVHRKAIEASPPLTAAKMQRASDRCAAVREKQTFRQRWSLQAPGTTGAPLQERIARLQQRYPTNTGFLHRVHNKFQKDHRGRSRVSRRAPLKRDSRGSLVLITATDQEANWDEDFPRVLMAQHQACTSAGLPTDDLPPKPANALTTLKPFLASTLRGGYGSRSQQQPLPMQMDLRDRTRRGGNGGSATNPYARPLPGRSPVNQLLQAGGLNVNSGKGGRQTRAAAKASAWAGQYRDYSPSHHRSNAAALAAGTASAEEPAEGVSGGKGDGKIESLRSLGLLKKTSPNTEKGQKSADGQKRGKRTSKNAKGTAAAAASSDAEKPEPGRAVSRAEDLVINPDRDRDNKRKRNKDSGATPGQPGKRGGKVRKTANPAAGGMPPEGIQARLLPVPNLPEGVPPSLQKVRRAKAAPRGADGKIRRLDPKAIRTARPGAERGGRGVKRGMRSPSRTDETLSSADPSPSPWGNPRALSDLEPDDPDAVYGLESAERSYRAGTGPPVLRAGRCTVWEHPAVMHVQGKFKLIGGRSKLFPHGSEKGGGAGIVPGRVISPPFVPLRPPRPMYVPTPPSFLWGGDFPSFLGVPKRLLLKLFLGIRTGDLYRQVNRRAAALVGGSAGGVGGKSPSPSPARGGKQKEKEKDGPSAAASRGVSATVSRSAREGGEAKRAVGPTLSTVSIPASAVAGFPGGPLDVGGPGLFPPFFLQEAQIRENFLEFMTEAEETLSVDVLERIRAEIVELAEAIIDSQYGTEGSEHGAPSPEGEKGEVLSASAPPVEAGEKKKKEGDGEGGERERKDEKETQQLNGAASSSQMQQLAQQQSFKIGPTLSAIMKIPPVLGTEAASMDVGSASLLVAVVAGCLDRYGLRGVEESLLPFIQSERFLWDVTGGMGGLLCGSVSQPPVSPSRSLPAGFLLDSPSGAGAGVSGGDTEGRGKGGMKGPKGETGLGRLLTVGAEMFSRLRKQKEDKAEGTEGDSKQQGDGGPPAESSAASSSSASGGEDEESKRRDAEVLEFCEMLRDSGYDLEKLSDDLRNTESGTPTEVIYRIERVLQNLLLKERTEPDPPPLSCIKDSSETEPPPEDLIEASRIRQTRYLPVFPFPPSDSTSLSLFGASSPIPTPQLGTVEPQMANHTTQMMHQTLAYPQPGQRMTAANGPHRSPFTSSPQREIDPTYSSSSSSSSAAFRFPSGVTGPPGPSLFPPHLSMQQPSSQPSAPSPAPGTFAGDAGGGRGVALSHLAQQQAGSLGGMIPLQLLQYPASVFSAPPAPGAPGGLRPPPPPPTPPSSSSFSSSSSSSAAPQTETQTMDPFLYTAAAFGLNVPVGVYNLMTLTPTGAPLLSAAPAPASASAGPQQVGMQPSGAAAGGSDQLGGVRTMPIGSSPSQPTAAFLDSNFAAAAAAAAANGFDIGQFFAQQQQGIPGAMPSFPMGPGMRPQSQQSSQEAPRQGGGEASSRKRAPVAPPPAAPTAPGTLPAPQLIPLQLAGRPVQLQTSPLQAQKRNSGLGQQQKREEGGGG